MKVRERSLQSAIQVMPVKMYKTKRDLRGGRERDERGELREEREKRREGGAEERGKTMVSGNPTPQNSIPVYSPDLIWTL